MEPRLDLSATAGAITLRQLHYFVAVAEEEHFTRASERLLIAQPALSRQVGDLEKILEVDLFARETRGIRLTEAGRELLVRARTLLASLERTVDAVRAAGDEECRRLRLGYYGPSFFNNDVTVVALERFRAESPDVRIVSHELFSEQLIDALREDRIDVGISRGRVHASGIDAAVIATERAVVLMAVDDPLARKPEISLADLDGRGLIVFQRSLSAGLNARIAEIAIDAGITLPIVQEVAQLPSFGYYVARDERIAIVPASSGTFSHPGVITRTIVDPGATIDMIAIWRHGEESPTVLRFVALLTASAVDAPSATADAGAGAARPHVEVHHA